MENLQYKNIINKLVNFFNNGYYKNNDLQIQCLFHILDSMYKKQFGKQVNYGALAQILCNHQGKTLTSIIEQDPEKNNNVLVFNEKENSLKIADILEIKVSNCPRIMEEEAYYGDCIEIKLNNKKENTKETFILYAQEDELWIIHKQPGLDSINPRSNETKSYEKRRFDNSGIEIEREISTEVSIGIKSPYNALNRNDFCNISTIKNTIRISRNETYFKIANIDMIQKHYITGQYTLKNASETTKGNRMPFIMQQLYGLCSYGQSLDVIQTTDNLDDALFICKGETYLNMNNISDEERGPDTDPKLDFIPDMNETIKLKIQKAKEQLKSGFKL